GPSPITAVAPASIAAFASGILIAIGPAAAFVGLQSCVAVLIAGGFPLTLAGAAGAAAIVFAGGMIQTILVMTIWPLRRFAVERRTIASAYRTLASYAHDLPARHEIAPEPREAQQAIWQTIDACLAALPKNPAIDALLGQIRAAWRTAGMLTSAVAGKVALPRLAPLRALPPIGDALTTLRANLSLASTA